MESVAAERDALKETLVKFTEEKEMLIVESEDTAQKLEKLHETKMRWVFETVKAIAFKFIFREKSLFVTEDIGCLNCSSEGEIVDQILRGWRWTQIQITVCWVFLR